jgi:hypothetical protein
LLTGLGGNDSLSGDFGDDVYAYASGQGQESAVRSEAIFAASFSFYDP